MSAPAGVHPRDPGLQPERTRLAWRRTTLTCTVAAVLAGRQAVQEDAGTLTHLAVGCSLLLWLAFIAVAHRRIRELARSNRPGAPRRATVAAAALCTVGLAAFAVGVVL
ncbi:DUF202 domain-containing protein [Streptomyces triticagri]|uniref:DUF202 domain-containing protein n=1 Tax=Streptomyces triticagri TaxID=2293568 RepID=UPI001F454B73|nr:DUF202 domain-containing protein [Streptomyces triticagri]